MPECVFFFKKRKVKNNRKCPYCCPSSSRSHLFSQHCQFSLLFLLVGSHKITHNPTPISPLAAQLLLSISSQQESQKPEPRRAFLFYLGFVLCDGRSAFTRHFDGVVLNYADANVLIGDQRQHVLGFDLKVSWNNENNDISNPNSLLC